MSERERQLLFLFRAGLLPLVGMAQLDDWKASPELSRVRANLIALLGSVEDAAGVARTLPTRDQRRAQRDHVS